MRYFARIALTLLLSTLAAVQFAQGQLARATPCSTPCDGVETLVGDETQCVKPMDSFRDCADCPEMVVVPAGSFLMGSPKSEEGRFEMEGPQHEVAIARPFAVGRFAVTRSEFAAFVRETNHATGDKCWVRNDEWEWRTGSFRNPGFSQNDQHPAVCMSWDDAKAFVTWFAKKTGKPYRLLTEAEREYVTRAGTSTPFWWGSSISTTQANYDGNQTYAGGSKGEWPKKTVTIDSFEANPWGLYNVHGNVLEWVEDCWHDSYQGAPTDGSAWTSGRCDRRVVRGGAWISHPRFLRSAARTRSTPDIRFYTDGFRLARTLSL